jgi:hypothetical protein
MAETRPGSAGLSSSERHERHGAPPAHRAHRARRALRPLSPAGHPLRGTSALLALLLLLGGFESHPAGESHDPVAGLAGHQHDVFFPAASHPVAPAHAEAAAAVQRPLCAVCINGLRGNASPVAPVARLAAPRTAQPLPAAAAVSPLRQPLRPEGGRAPPLA